MTLLGHIRTRARLIIGPVMAATLFAYFAYHAVQGDRGLLAWVKLGQQVDDARLEHARIAALREALEEKVRRLQPGSLDADLLEERTRVMLGYVHRDDIVIGRDGLRPGGLNPISDPVPVGMPPAPPREAGIAGNSGPSGLIVRISH